MASNEIVEGLRRMADLLSTHVAAFQRPEITEPLDRLEDAAMRAQKAWSESSLGYHSRVY